MSRFYPPPPPVPPRRRRVAPAPADLQRRSVAEQQVYWNDRLNSALNADEYDPGEIVYCRGQLLELANRRLSAVELRAAAYERLLRRIKNALDAQDQRRLLARAKEIGAVLTQYEGDPQ